MPFTTTPLRILVIDDSEDDIFFFKRTLSHSGINATVVAANDPDEGIDLLTHEDVECVFLDYNLQATDGFHVLKRLRGLGVDVPIIMLTGQKDEQMIVKLMREGASDYLPKAALTGEVLRLSIENALKVYRIHKEKAMAELALKESEARLAEAQRIAQLGNWEYNYQTKELLLSYEAQKILDTELHTPYPSLDTIKNMIHKEDMDLILDCITSMSKQPDCDINVRLVAKDGTIKYVNLKYRVCRTKDQTIDLVLGTIQDITVLKQALQETKKATIKSKATTIVMSIAVFLFLFSEAVIDPIIDSITASLIISLSCKGSIAVALKPMEQFLERIMLSRATV